MSATQKEPEESPKVGELFNPYRQLPCGLVPEEVVLRDSSLTVAARVIFWRLVKRSRAAVVTVSHRTLATETAMSERHVRRCLRELQTHGFVRATRGGDGRPSSYSILWHTAYEVGISDRTGGSGLSRTDRTGGSGLKKSRPAISGIQSGHFASSDRTCLSDYSVSFRSSPVAATSPARAEGKPDGGASMNREPTAEQIEAVGGWLCDFVGGQWPPPDEDLIRQVIAAANGVDLLRVRDYLLQLHRQGRRPKKSYSWFSTLIRGRFEGADASQAV